MAPNFALFLSPEGIALAQRQPAGHWAVLGDTPLDVPDLGASLLVLRKLAEARVGKGFETLILLPDDQILYTSLTAPGPDEEERLEQIRAGLDGLTPYPVDQLAFDWFPLEDGRVKLAVVAQETLEEARQFAEANGFTPVGFGGRPLDNRYRGVAHFDRSLDWVAEIDDIEFGHDTWHKHKPKAESDEAAAPEDAVEAEEPAAPVEEAPVEAAAMAPAQEADEPAAENDAAPTEAPQEDGADEAGRVEAAAPEPVAEEKVGPEATDPAPRADASAGQDAPDQPDRAAPAGRLHLGVPVAAEETSQDETPPEDSATAEPIAVPSGFGTRRRGAEPPKEAGALVGSRAPRFGPGAVKPEEAEATPQLPRDRSDKADERAEPSLGRAARSGDAAAPGSPARPRAAGPEPKLPPLARLKSELKSRPAAEPEETPKGGFGNNPFSRRKSGETPGKGSFRDRMAELGKQLSASREAGAETETTDPKTPETATAPEAEQPKRLMPMSLRPAPEKQGLGGRLKALGSRLSKDKEDAPGAADTPAEAAPAPPPPAAESGPKKRGRKPKAKPAEAEAAARSAEAIAPPPEQATSTNRRRFMASGGRRRKEAEIADADAPIMGGLLARGTVAANRGPSMRTGLIMTLILLVVLALIGVWAAFYLPETALGRWMGLGTEEDTIIAETDPGGLESPVLGLGEGGEVSPVELARLTEEGALPGPATMAPSAPELLPDIDADLDLEPEPVRPPPIDPETVLPSEEENANFYARTGIWQRPPVITLPSPDTDPGELIFAGLDPRVESHDAVALGAPGPLPVTELAALQGVSISPADEIFMTAEDLVEPSAEGTLNPYGILVYAGPPAVTPVPRPRDAPAAIAAAAAEAAAEAVAETVALAGSAGETPQEAAAQEDEAATAGAVELALLRAISPTPRPDDLQEQRERAVLGGITFDELSNIRPEGRPASVQELAAEAAAADGTAGSGTGTELAVAISFVPRLRPGNIEDLVEEARAAGNSGPTPPVAAAASDTIELDIPSSASVTRAATEENAINLRRVNLIGVSGAPSERRALVRLPSGRFVTVEVGDRLDGGQVAAIGESSLQYVKQGRTITLEVPAG